MNEKLTKVLEWLRVRSFKRNHFRKDRVETLEKELSNCKKQIILYHKEIEFLESRVEEGDQLDRVKLLQMELIEKEQQVELLKKSLGQARNKNKISERNLRIATNDKVFEHKVLTF